MQDAAGTATADTSAGRRVRGPRVALLVKLCREREPNRATRSQPRANGGWTEGTGGEHCRSREGASRKLEQSEAIGPIGRGTGSILYKFFKDRYGFTHVHAVASLLVRSASGRVSVPCGVCGACGSAADRLSVSQSNAERFNLTKKKRVPT